MVYINFVSFKLLNLSSLSTTKCSYSRRDRQSESARSVQCWQVEQSRQCRPLYSVTQLNGQSEPVHPQSAAPKVLGPELGGLLGRADQRRAAAFQLPNAQLRHQHSPYYELFSSDQYSPRGDARSNIRFGMQTDRQTCSEFLIKRMPP